VTAFNGFRYRPRSIADVVREFQLIREKRVLVVDSFIIGLDIDKPGIGKHVAEVAHQYGVDYLNMLFLTPLPGTKLWKKMESEKRIRLETFPGDWKYYALTFPVARYKHLSLDWIIQEMNSCNRNFYSMPRILKRTFSSLWGQRHPLISLIVNFSYWNNLRQNHKILMDFKAATGQ